jgi:plastocyanin
MQFFSIRHAPTLVPALLTLLLAGCDRGPAATAGDRETQTVAATNRETPTASPAQVVIDNFTYAPASLTVAVGTKVTWVNHDDVPHTVTSPSKPRILDSPMLDTDDKFSFEFKTAGTYDYYCAVHPKMTGQIIVK